MVYVKDAKGKLKTLKEISIDFNVPLALVQGRWNNGVRDLEKLIQPKYSKWGEEE
jgi:hypothetical protein